MTDGRVERLHAFPALHSPSMAARAILLTSLLVLLVAPTVAAAQAVCGNGILEAGEGCDDGDLDNNDNCPDKVGDTPPGTCQPATCGDGHVWNIDGGKEVCDDGNNDDTDGCPDGASGLCTT